MEKESLIIYDDSCFKEVTIHDLTEGRIGILYKTFNTIWSKEKKYKISREELNLLIKENKLIIANEQSLYQNVSEHDQMICFALSNNLKYDVTVFTKNQELALDLLLSGIKVKTENYSTNFVNIGKSDEKNDIYVYDTCVLLNNIEEIDFSKNTHYIPVCVLEELINNNDISNPKVIDEAFFKCIYVYNKYPQNVKILNTVTSTQRGGRYSYTDLLILYSTIRLKNELKDRNISLVTKDRQLFFESMYMNLFNVVNKFDYFEDKAHVEENTHMHSEESEDLKEQEESTDDIVEDILNDAYICDESETTSKDFLESEENEDSTESITSLEKDVINFTNNYKELPLRKLHRKNVVNLPEVIEHVYNENFRLITPVLRRKLEKGFTAQTYIVKVGYYITFKNNPGVSYRVVGINNLIATLTRI